MFIEDRNLQIVVYCWACMDGPVHFPHYTVSHVTKVKKMRLMGGKTILQCVNCNLVLDSDGREV